MFCVIKLSVDSRNDESVYLLEEGLELWLATLHNSKTLLPQWMELTKFMPPILGKCMGKGGGIYFGMYYAPFGFDNTYNTNNYFYFRTWKREL